MAPAATGSLSGGKRGFSRRGASIMWPLNNTTLRGDSGLGSDMCPVAALSDMATP
jgi:hypothetical protein